MSYLAHKHEFQFKKIKMSLENNNLSANTVQLKMKWSLTTLIQ